MKQNSNNIVDIRYGQTGASSATEDGIGAFRLGAVLEVLGMFTLTGVRLQKVPQKGFYIVRQGGKTRKMLAK